MKIKLPWEKIGRWLLKVVGTALMEKLVEEQKKREAAEKPQE